MAKKAKRRTARKTTKKTARKAAKRAPSRGAYTLVHRNRALGTYPTLAAAEAARDASGMRGTLLRIVKE